MKKYNLAALAGAVLTFAVSLASGPLYGSQAGGLDRSILEASAINVEIELPTDMPTLTWLKRGPMRFGEQELVDKFFKKGTTSTAKQIYSPIYGDGKLYSDSGGRTLRVFKYGFEFDANPAKIERVLTLNERGDKSYVYSVEEGKLAALKFTSTYIGEMPAQAKEMSVKQSAIIGEEADGLFVLTTNKYFRGVQLLDDYIQVVLDSNRSLVNFAYFWDDELAPGPGVPDKKIIDAGFAVNQAKRWVIQQAGGQTFTDRSATVTNIPYLTLINMKLGYVNLRGDYITVVPAWLLMCRWQHRVDMEVGEMESVLPKQHPLQKRFIQYLEHFDYYIAIEALTGKPTML
ncbi:MAG: hypothetical protein HRF49_06960 [bacterium]|jgi:hypothetical protein